MVEENRVLISPISIDMGAINTGAFLAQYELGSEDSIEKTGLIINIPADKLTLSQKTRTQRRHMVRALKRRKMAKRLFRVILKGKYNLDFFRIADEEQQFLNGLFNRRGFTYYLDSDTDAIEKADKEKLSQLVPEIDADLDIKAQMSTWGADKGIWEKIINNECMSWNKDEWKKRLAGMDKSEGSILQKAVQQIKQTIDNFDRAVNEGHRPRKEYLKNVSKDVDTYWNDIPSIHGMGITAGQLSNLIGHISNLQLRCLRKYFNNPEWKNSLDGEWDQPRLTRCFSRYIKAWHVDSEDAEIKTNRTMLMNQLADGRSVIDIWLDMDPMISIPPDEDQNNRRPPKCMTLLLDEEALNRHFPEWEIWTEPTKFGMDEAFLELPLTRRLQAILDRTISGDVVKTRELADALAFGKEFTSAQKEQIEILEARIGCTWKQFLICAGRYYGECKEAAQGAWYPEKPDTLLRLCGKNPPHKNKIMDRLVSHILGKQISAEKLQELRGFLKEHKVNGSKMINIARKASEMQKEYGISFNECFFDSANEDIEIAKLKVNLLGAGAELASYLGCNDKERLSNPYTMAQLYNLLETDVHGFSSTCRECTIDNSLRNARAIESDANAFAKRLPADTARPFDGLINRLIIRLAHELAQAKKEQILEEIRGSDSKNTSVIVPVIIEENRFEFTEEISKIKKEQMGTTIDSKRLDLMHDNQENRWAAKGQRIKEDALEVCPYCGLAINEGSAGEIDHIIPRSESLKQYGVVFNVEPNLIFSHSSCNRKKGERRLTIQDLDPAYLARQFGSSDCKTVTLQITEKVTPFMRRDSKFMTAFHSLPRETRVAVRHSLFIPELCELMISYLHQQQKSRVNGTQQWFIKQFSRELRKKLGLAGIDCFIRGYRIDSSRIHDLRQVVAGIDEGLIKDREQSAYSHIVDAALAFAEWLESNQDAREYSSGSLIEKLKEPEGLFGLLPSSFNVNSLQRKPVYIKKAISSRKLFSDTIYGDRALSYIVHRDGSCAIGFNPSERIPIIKGPDWVFDTLRPFFKWNGEADDLTFEKVTSSAIASKVSVIIGLSKQRINEYRLRNKRSSEVSVLETMKLLKEITYNIVKTNVKSKLIKARSVLEEKKLIEDKLLKKSTINVAYSSKKASFNGKLLLPSYRAWKRIIDDSILLPLWGKDFGKDFNWDALLTKHFSNGINLNNNPAHKKVRKVFSLPLKEDPAGQIVVKRRNQDGTIAWHTIKVDEAAFEGFEERAGTVDFKSPVVIRALRTSQKLAIQAREDVGKIRYMNEWRRVSIPESIAGFVNGLEIAPGSKERLRARIDMKRQFFEDRILKADARKAPVIFKCEWPFTDIQGPRRDSPNIVLVAMSEDNVVFEYTMNGQPSELRAAYSSSEIR